MKNIDVCYIISHGFASRMVMQTDLLGKLKDSGSSVAVICPNKDDSNLQEYCSSREIELYDLIETNKFYNQRYLNKRKYYLEDIHKNPALLEKHKRATLLNRSKNPVKHIWPRYYYLVYLLIKIFPGIRERFKKNEASRFDSQPAKELLNKLQPKKLVSTYPVNYLESILLKAGNENPNVETWIHLLSWDNISCKGHFPQLADKYIAWGNIMKEELIEYYNIDQLTIYECGVPHFDLYREISASEVQDVRDSLNINENDSIIMFAMSSPRFAPKEIEVVEWLAEKVSKKEMAKDSFLIVRPHPQNMTKSMGDTSWINRLDKLNTYDRVFVDYPQLNQSKLEWSMKKNDMNKLASYIKASSLVINSGSTVSIEALLCEKPVVLSSFDGNKNVRYWRSARRLIDYNHLAKLLSYGGITVAKNYDEFLNSIEQYLLDKNLKLKERHTTIGRQIADSPNYTNGVVEVLSGKQSE